MARSTDPTVVGIADAGRAFIATVFGVWVFGTGSSSRSKLELVVDRAKQYVQTGARLKELRAALRSKDPQVSMAANIALAVRYVEATGGHENLLHRSAQWARDREVEAAQRAKRARGRKA